MCVPIAKPPPGSTAAFFRATLRTDRLPGLQQRHRRCRVLRPCQDRAMEHHHHCTHPDIPRGAKKKKNFLPSQKQPKKIVLTLPFCRAELDAKVGHLGGDPRRRRRPLVQVRLQQHHRAAPRAHVGPQQVARRHRRQGGAQHLHQH